MYQIRAKFEGGKFTWEANTTGLDLINLENRKFKLM